MEKSIILKGTLLILSSITIILFRVLVLKAYDLALLIIVLALTSQIILTLVTFKWRER